MVSSLCEGRTSFCTGLISRKVCRFLFIFPTDFTYSMSYFFFLYRSPSSSLGTIFYSISSNIDEVLPMKPSANVFVFGDFNWLTYSGGANRYGELCYNFSISNNLTQMVNFPTWIPDCESHSPALLDFFLSSNVSICSTMAFRPLGNSGHVVVSVSIDFPSYSQPDAPFHRIASLVLIGTVFVITWEMFHGRISLDSVLLLLLVNFGWNWCIYPSSKVSGQASLISMVFSCFCSCHSS